MNVDQARARIAAAFDAYLEGGNQGHGSLVAENVGGGKLYEAYVLAHVVRHLVRRERFDLVLSVGSVVLLKGAPGPINPTYPHIQMWREGRHVANIWTDVEFTALSCHRTGQTPCEPGHYHELDIVVADADSSGRPTPEQIWLGIECKHRQYGKDMLRQILGVRRELSYLHGERRTRFRRWPANAVPAEPPSCLMVFSSSSNVDQYAAPGATFGIQFEHLPMM